MAKSDPKFIVSSTIAGTVLTVVYAIVADLSRDSSGFDLVYFLAAYGFSAAVVLSYWAWLYKQHCDLSFGIVFFWALIFRLLGIWGEPILEDDYFRYLLDACLFVTYGSPYGIAPETLFLSNALTPECEPLLSGVNNPHLSTIYAPFLQYIFVFAHLISPVNLDLLQGIVVLFDLAIILMLGKLAPARMVMLYAWCPLVVKEFAFTAHPDIIGVALLFGALLSKSRGKIAWACILVTLAACTKILAAAALPFILYRQPIRYWLIALAGAGLLYLPLLIQHQHSDIEILAHFAKTWRFNAPFFSLLSGLLNDQTARYVAMVVFLSWYAYYFTRYQAIQSATDIPRMDWIFGILFLLSPVLNAWYWVWILPFAVIWPSAWAWTGSVVLALSYMIGLNLPDSQLQDYEVAPLAQWAQLISVAIALLIDYRHRRIRSFSHH